MRIPSLKSEDENIPSMIDILGLKEQGVCIGYYGSGNYPREENGEFLPYLLDIANLDNKNLCFHAGTVSKDNQILAIGGRVLNFVSLSSSFFSAREKIFDNLKILNWDHGFFRKDIGYKVIDL